MANAIEKLNTIALNAIEKINGITQANVDKLNTLVALVAVLKKAIFGYGAYTSSYYSTTNKVSNTGVVASDTSGVGTPRENLAAASYGN